MYSVIRLCLIILNIRDYSKHCSFCLSVLYVLYNLILVLSVLSIFMFQSAFAIFPILVRAISFHDLIKMKCLSVFYTAALHSVSVVNNTVFKQ